MMFLHVVQRQVHHRLVVLIDLDGDPVPRQRRGRRLGDLGLLGFLSGLLGHSAMGTHGNGEQADDTDTTAMQ